MAKKKKNIYKLSTNSNGKIKQEIKELLDMLGISKSYFKKTMPRIKEVDGEKVITRVRGEGQRLSLKQQRDFLVQLITANQEMKEFAEEQKKNIMKDQEIKSAMQDNEPTEQELHGLVQSVFDR